LVRHWECALDHGRRRLTAVRELRRPAVFQSGVFVLFLGRIVGQEFARQYRQRVFVFAKTDDFFIKLDRRRAIKPRGQIDLANSPFSIKDTGKISIEISRCGMW
jgi:hypothetical protein